MPETWYEWVGCAIVLAFLISSVAYGLYAMRNDWGEDGWL
jgi:hypothetical protein